MGAEPGRRILKQPAAKLEPVIVVLVTILQTDQWKFYQRFVELSVDH